MTDDDRIILTTYGISKRFKRAVRTIQWWCQEGKLKAKKNKSGHWQITEAAVKALMELKCNCKCHN